MKLFLIAIEPSADALGAGLIQALRRRHAGLAVAGVGGAAMQAEGLVSLFDPAPLAVVGLTEALRVGPLALRRSRQAADAAMAVQPDAAVLIDAWGFTTQVARRLRALQAPFPLIKYVGPQVWAARAGRARKVAALYDRLVALLPIEQPFYAGLGLPLHVCGMPALQNPQQGDAAAFRRRHGLAGPLLLLAPGSRSSEIRDVAPVLAAAAAQACRDRPDWTVVCPVAPAVRAAVEASAAHWPFPHRLITDPAERPDAFAASAVALAASGTVTSEIALQGAALVVGYRVSWLTAEIMRRLIVARFITLINIAADREIAPEFVQERFTVAAVAGAVARLMDDPAARVAQAEAQRAALALLAHGERPAAEVAADAVEAAIAAGPRPRSEVYPTSGGGG